MEKTNYDPEELNDLLLKENLLNADQKIIYDSIIKLLNKSYYDIIIETFNDKENQSVFFVDGPGGYGKTFLFNIILAYVRSQKKIAIAVASSGIAALLLNGGRTAHSKFKIPLNLTENSVLNIKP